MQISRLNHLRAMPYRNAGKVMRPLVRFGAAQEPVLTVEEQRILRTVHLGLSERSSLKAYLTNVFLKWGAYRTDEVPVASVLKDAAAPEEQLRQALGRLQQERLIEVFNNLRSDEQVCSLTDAGLQYLQKLAEGLATTE